MWGTKGEVFEIKEKGQETEAFQFQQFLNSCILNSIWKNLPFAKSQP